MESNVLEKNKRIALRGILVALALILSYIESFIPVSSAVPGIKLGLANIVTIYALKRLGLKDTLIISFLRCFFFRTCVDDVCSLSQDCYQ